MQLWVGDSIEVIHDPARKSINAYNVRLSIDMKLGPSIEPILGKGTNVAVASSLVKVMDAISVKAKYGGNNNLVASSYAYL